MVAIDGPGKHTASALNARETMVLNMIVNQWGSFDLKQAGFCFTVEMKRKKSNCKTRAKIKDGQGNNFM